MQEMYSALVLDNMHEFMGTTDLTGSWVQTELKYNK